VPGSAIKTKNLGQGRENAKRFLKENTDLRVEIESLLMDKLEIEDSFEASEKKESTEKK